MPVRAEVRGSTPPEFEVIGTGTIGEKAEQLRSKTPKLKEIGWHVPRRMVLANSFFTDLLSANGVSIDDQTPDLEERVRSGRFAEGQHATLQRVLGSHGRKPLVIRSSAEGDSRGTGIYESVFVDGSVEGITHGLKEVYASYFSEDAVLFRRDAGLEDGLGVIIEPLIGQDIEGKGTAPLLSGYGYTSVPKAGTLGAFIDVVPGLGGGVDTRDGERIDRWQIATRDYNLGDYITDRRFDALHTGNPDDKSSLLGFTDEYQHMNRFLVGGVFISGGTDWFGIPFGSKVDNRIAVPDLHVFDEISLEPLFEMLEETEKKFNKRQYVEFAITYTGGDPKFWLTQIDDREKFLEEVDLGEGRTILEAKNVHGNGERVCSKVFVCSTQGDIDALARFNRVNEGYLLMYGGNLATGKFLKYRHFSNAGAVVEVPTGQKSKKSISHFGGMIEESGKFFGVVNDDAQEIDFDFLEQNRKEEFGKKVHQGRVKVIASEFEDRMVVRPLEE